MHFLIFTGGDINPGRAVTKALLGFDKIIAVDSGASHCLKYKLTPDFLVGDFDSIDKKVLAPLKSGKTEIIEFPKDKDQTDTELGIQTAIENGATEISIFGGVAGDRIDHILANIMLLKQFDIPIKFINADSTLWLGKGPKTEKIEGAKGDLLSLIPLSIKVSGIQTKALKYPLNNESLVLGKSRGVSNVFIEKTASVKWKTGLLLLTHTLA